jgi:arylsulfatase A-like enzyme
MNAIVIALVVGVLGSASVAGGAEPTPRPGKPESPNVLLITVDSFRPDHIGAYGYRRATTPTIDRLARHGVVFRAAFNQAAWTSPPLVSMLTSLYPTAHGVDYRSKSFDPSVMTPLRRLREAGYAVPGICYLISLPEFENLGFEPVEQRTLDAWLKENAARPFFAWIHLEGPHLPLNPPPPYDRMFTPGGQPLPPEVLTRLRPFREQPVIPRTEASVDPRDRDAVLALSDGKVRRTDAEIGRILESLERFGLSRSTVVIVTADHGEELLDHGFIGHASTSLAGTLFDELIHVPLVIAYPGVLAEGRTIRALVEGIDVLPTVLDLLGVAPPPVAQGRSLLPLIRGKAVPRTQRVFAETTTCGRSCPEGQDQGRLQAVRTPTWKLIRTEDARGERFTLYHVASDPKERRDAAAGHPQIVSRLRAELARHVVLNQAKADELRAMAALASRPVAESSGTPGKPKIVRPRDGGQLTFVEQSGRVVVEWEGRPDGRYVLEYDVGAGRYRMRGDFTVIGPRKAFGPLKADVWNQLVFYNPYRVRIRPARCEAAACWSEWVTFKIGS